jgi:hypothetical protein
MWLVDLFECMMMHGLTNPKFKIKICLYNYVSISPFKEQQGVQMQRFSQIKMSSITCTVVRFVTLMKCKFYEYNQIYKSCVNKYMILV